MALKKLDPSLYKNKVEHPKETVYEIITAENGLGWGLAIADIEESELHVHKKVKEIYVVLEGALEITLDGHRGRFKPGTCIEIFSGVKHKARSLRKERARVGVFSIPPWISKDHFILKT